MSGQSDRDKRREERLAAESTADGADRRTRLLQLSAGGVFLAIIVVVVIIIVAGSGGGGSSVEPSEFAEKAAVEKLLTGIPQEGTALGKKTAPVKLYEYGDLQCSACKLFSEEILPEVIENQVASGKASISFRNFTIIGEDSLPAGEAFLAAGAQGKGWSYLETWYRNQGGENSGYVTEDFVNAMARYVGVPNLAKFTKEWKSGKYKQQVESTTAQANKFGFGQTPSFAVEGPGSKGLELIGTPQTSKAIEEAMEKAA